MGFRFEDRCGVSSSSHSAGDGGQQPNRTLRDIAAEVEQTGVLPLGVVPDDQAAEGPTGQENGFIRASTPDTTSPGRCCSPCRALTATSAPVTAGIAH